MFEGVGGGSHLQREHLLCHMVLGPVHHTHAALPKDCLGVDLQVVETDLLASLGVRTKEG